MIHCTATVDGDNINLIIRKSEPGYKEFAQILRKIKEHEFMSWYGDVIDADGNEQCGLIITNKS